MCLRVCERFKGELGAVVVIPLYNTMDRNELCFDVVALSCWLSGYVEGKMSHDDWY